MRLINTIDTEEIFEIPDEDGEYIIGRAVGIALTIRSKNLSSKHCKIIVHENKYTVADLDSSNGTFVNGNRIKQAVLRNNSILQLGAIKFRVEISADGDEEEGNGQQAIMTEASAEVVDQAPIPETSKDVADPTEIIEASEVAENQTEIPQRAEKPDRPSAKYPQAKKRVPTKSHKKPQVDKTSPQIKKAGKTKPEKAKTQNFSTFWVVIFFAGAFIGISLIAVSFVLKGSSDAEFQKLRTEIKTLTDDNTTLNNSIRISKRKLEEFTTKFAEFKIEISTATDNINNAQRSTMTDVNNVKTLSDEIKKSIKTIEDNLSEIDNKIENLTE